MMNRLWFLGCALVCGAVLLAAPEARGDDSAESIVKRALDQNSTGLQAGVGNMTVMTENKAGDKKKRVLSFKGKGGAAGRRTLIRLLEPEEVAGQAFLFVEVLGGEDQVHWYLPAFGVTRRIQGGQKRGAFMGTHFTYADLESRDIKDAAHTMLPAEKVGAQDAYVIESKPKGDSEYSKVVLYIRKSDDMLLKARFFDASGAESKVLFIEKIDSQKGERYVSQMTLRPKAGGYTRLTVNSIELGADVPDVVFSPQALANE